MKKKLAILVATVALVLCMPLTAFAGNAFDNTSVNTFDSVNTTNAGNAFIIEAPISATDVENDLYWTGRSLDASKLNVGTSGHGSILAAGMSLQLKNVTVADSVRMAAQDIVLEHAKVGNNITLAGQDVYVGNEVAANGLYIAGKNVTVGGVFNGGMIAGDSITINGTIKDTLIITAQSVTIGQNAKILGHLEVVSPNEVAIPDSAEVSNFAWTQDGTENSAPEDNSPLPLLIGMIYALAAHILLVGLFFAIIRKPMVDAANMARKRLLKILIAGLVVFILAPIACILLIFPLVTIPIMVLLLLVMIVIALFSIPFAGSALGMMLWGKKMNPLLAAIIGAAILTVCAYVPVLSSITPIFCIIFTAGFLWLRWREICAARKNNSQETNSLTEG